MSLKLACNLPFKGPEDLPFFLSPFFALTPALGKLIHSPYFRPNVCANDSQALVPSAPTSLLSVRNLHPTDIPEKCMCPNGAFCQTIPPPPRYGLYFGKLVPPIPLPLPNQTPELSSFLLSFPLLIGSQFSNV